jgi:hypothetical protein
MGGESACSLDPDFRNCCPNVCTDRGLRGKPEDLVDGESFPFIDDIDGVSLILSALEKLHFFEGVLVIGGADSGAEQLP